MYLQINTVKYNTDREIMNIYENLWIVWSQFCTDRLLFIYIQSTSNIYWFIGIRICCQRILTNSYLGTFGYYQYLVQHLMNDTEGKKTTICHYLLMTNIIILLLYLFKFMAPSPHLDINRKIIVWTFANIHHGN